jgi:hypothetical protein
VLSQIRVSKKVAYRTQLRAGQDDVNLTAVVAQKGNANGASVARRISTPPALVMAPVKMLGYGRIVGFGAVVCPSGKGFTLCCPIGLTVSICFGAS